MIGDKWQANMKIMHSVMWSKESEIKDDFCKKKPLIKILDNKFIVNYFYFDRKNNIYL